MKRSTFVPALVLAASSVLFAAQAQAETLGYLTNQGNTGVFGTIDSAAPGTDTTGPRGGVLGYTLETGDTFVGADVDVIAGKLFLLAKNGTTCKVYSTQPGSFENRNSVPLFTKVSSFTCPAGALGDIVAAIDSGDTGFRLVVANGSSFVDIDGRGSKSSAPDMRAITLTGGGGNGSDMVAVDRRPTTGDSDALRGIDFSDNTFVRYSLGMSDLGAETSVGGLGITLANRSVTLDKSEATGVYYLLANAKLFTVNATSGAATQLGNVISNTVVVLANPFCIGDPTCSGNGGSGSTFTPNNAQTKTADCGTAGNFMGEVEGTATLSPVTCGMTAPLTTDQTGGVFNGSGALRYVLSNVTAGQSVRVRFTRVGGGVNSAYKCTVTAGVCGNYTAFPSVADGNSIIITLVNGGAGDTDSSATTITDPIVVGTLTPQNNEKGFFDFLGAFGSWTLMPLLGLAAFRRRKKA